jgi:asparagine synthase (glutamine-hydrolysing)
MCGIVGKVTPDQPVDQELLSRMCASLAHRGPDEQQLHVEGRVGLGIRRLAIIDIQTGGQPLYSEDRRVVLVFNGEIYNHRELRDRLEAGGHVFRGGSDGEVLVHLWEDLGPACVERLRGMFAFAIWDARTEELFLARDRVGKKPLYYSLREGTLRFASEPRAIFQDEEVPREADPRALDAYLVNQYVPHHLCAFKGLHKLPPASSLRWRPGGDVRVERYWRLAYEPDELISLAEAQERVRELILEATRLRLMSDVPIGAFLSGGIDSSAVVAAMARTSSERVRTFSVVFPGWGQDEAPYARLVADRYSTDHHELEVRPVDVSLLPRMAWYFGEPFADPAALPTYQLSELARRQVTVALNGDGGDESFAGYGRYWKFAGTRAVDALPSRGRERAATALRALAGRTDGANGVSRAVRVADRLALEPAERYSDFFNSFTSSDRARLYHQEFKLQVADGDPLAHIRRAWGEGRGLAAADRIMGVDLETYLPDDLLAKVDVASMARSLEMRSPLLDHELMQFAARLPARMKLRGRRGKVVLRGALRPWLPEEVIERRKQGFAVPVAKWLRNELRTVPEEVLLDPIAQARQLFAPSAVRRLIDEHRGGADRSWQLWGMINLELWYQTCVDAAPVSPQAVPASLSAG